MTHVETKSYPLSKSAAKRIWLRAQRLDSNAPFGDGPAATPAAVEHLGYVQIDTIHVIERCHHHILFTRIPAYERSHLHQAQSVDKTVFEYWTHALSYLPTRDFRYFMPAMRHYRRTPLTWFRSVKKEEVRKVMRLIRRDGALTIRDIDDDVLVEKDHPWASRKPSKRAMQYAFFTGAITVSERSGMLKAYDLTLRHFGWSKPPKPATDREFIGYIVERGLRAQGIISLDSVSHLTPSLKPAIRRLIEAMLRRGELVGVAVDGAGKTEHWLRPETLEAIPEAGESIVHLLSPFDPLVIQRKRLKLFFDYDHRFEAYVPRDKRVFGYFALPVLSGEDIVAAIDLKTDREKRRLLVQKWTWVGDGAPRRHKAAIEAALDRFERFQLAT